MIAKTSIVLAGVVLGVVGLAGSASGGEHHVVFSASYPVSGLSVPVPAGFHHRFFSNGPLEGGGIMISDTAIPPGRAQWSQLSPWRSNQVTLVVNAPGPGYSHEPFPSRRLPLPVTRDDLGCASGRLPLCGVGGQIPIRASDSDYSTGTQPIGVDLWLGPKASDADRLAILSALQGIKLG